MPPSSGTKTQPHKHRRRFIGPMPESVLVSEVPANRQSQKKRRWFSSGSGAYATSQEDEDQCLAHVIKVHAYDFFKNHGGKDEDWGDEEEISVREEMLKRWKQTEWGKLRTAKDGGVKNRWVGTSFDVGTFLGVNVLDKPTVSASPTSSPPASPTKSTHLPPVLTEGKSPAAETFITAPSQLSRRSPTRRDGIAPGALSDLQDSPTYLTTFEDQPTGNLSEELLPGPSRVMDHILAPDITHSTGTAENSVTPSKRKGKKKQVHYEDVAYDDQPTSPSNVLARSGQEVAETSAGAVEAARVDTLAEEEGGVIMRGKSFS